jgi:hypothetical protein
VGRFFIERVPKQDRTLLPRDVYQNAALEGLNDYFNVVKARVA